MSLLIRRVRTPENPEQDTDILIEDGTISAVGADLDAPGAQVLDGTGLMAAPGLLDMHVHFREPGFEYKETIETGCAAAAKGGVTAVACMANTDPVIDSPEMVELVLERARNACGVHVLPVAAVTCGQKGKELTDAAALKEAGAVALSDDGVPVQDAAVMRQALLHSDGLPILCHCEDADMVGNAAVNEGKISEKLGLPGRPAVAEEIMAMRDAMLAEETGGHVHICHVSTARTVDIVRQYKKKGVNITCETCPHYFTLTEEALVELGSMARVNPPLRTEEDMRAVAAGLADGTIDAIVTDHAPHSAEEKAKTLAEAPSGISGLETSLAIALTELYHSGIMTLKQVLDAMTVNPARVLNLPEPALKAGCRGDVVLFDPDEEWTVDPGEFASKGKNTPFAGLEVKGRVHGTVADGKVLYRYKI